MSRWILKNVLAAKVLRVMVLIAVEISLFCTRNRCVRVHGEGSQGSLKLFSNRSERHMIITLVLGKYA